MTTRSSPGLGQWFVVTFIVVVVVFLLYNIYRYGEFRQFFPAGLTVGGVDVGGLTEEQAADLLSSRYLEADVIVHHGEESIAVDPARAEFQLDMETMMNQADYQRAQQDFWAGFWGFLWNRPVSVEAIDLRATHNPDALRDVLETIASGMDLPAQPPQPVPATLSFQFGDPGIETDIEASLDEVEAALYRPSNREAHLTLRRVDAVRPDINILARFIVNHLQDQRFSGVASIFIMDLNSGEEVRIESSAAMSAVDLMKLPVLVETYRVLSHTPTLSQTQFIMETVTGNEPDGANRLLNVVAGQDDPYLGADLLTESLWSLGLQNTFMATPYGFPPRAGKSTYETPANSLEVMLTTPDPAMQTTAEEIGALLASLYYCAEHNGGSLRAAFGNQFTQDECQEILTFMQQNRIGSLIEEGVPPDVPVAHRHSWVGDTHADAGIVYSPGGDYVLVMILYQPEWLPWEVSSPLMAQLARATYNYFNFSAPYLDDSRAN